MANRQDVEIEEILTDAVDNTKRFVSSARDYVETIAHIGNKHEIVPYSPTTQIAVGVTAGYTGGWICSKMGKLALVLVGTAAIVIPLAEQAGYINVNWKRVEKDARLAQKNVERELKNAVGKSNMKHINVQEICKQNPQGTLAAVGGFILGFAL